MKVLENLDENMRKLPTVSLAKNSKISEKKKKDEKDELISSKVNVD